MRFAKAKAEVKTTQRQPKVEERARLRAEKALAEAQEALTAAQAEVERERQARLESERALTEAREALAVAKEKVEQERQARVKAEKALAEARAKFEKERLTPVKTKRARAHVEPAMTEASKSPKMEMGTMEMRPTAQREEQAERRISFIVRLTVDERGQPRRTEVEHAQSGKKETFPDLDSERLAAFMKACIGTVVTPEPAVLRASQRAKIGIATTEPSKPVSELTVSNVRLFRAGAPGVMPLTLSLEEASVLQVRFQLQGPEAASLATQESPYEVKVYANEVTSGKSKLLTTYNANLANDIKEYTTQMQVPRLPPGLYRLITLVTLKEPMKMAGYYEGPIVQVVGDQPLANSGTAMQAPLAQ